MIIVNNIEPSALRDHDDTEIIVVNNGDGSFALIHVNT